ncbi:MAG: hypothetical protein ACYDH3_00785 [Candidatus Aminicenantales bacterium]
MGFAEERENGGRAGKMTVAKKQPKMMDGKFAENVLIKARKSKEKISESISLFQSFLSLEGSSDLSKYDLARNRLRDGQMFWKKRSTM